RRPHQEGIDMRHSDSLHRISCILFCGLLAFASRTVSAAASSEAEQSFRKGMESLAAKKFEDACRFFSAAASDPAWQVCGLCNRAYCKRRMDDPEGALADYAACRELQPGYRPAILAQADLLIELGHSSDAQPLIANILQAHPDDACAHFLRARMFQKEAEIEQAIKEFKVAIRYDPTLLPAYAASAALYRQADMIKTAIAALDSAVELAPQNVAVREQRGRYILSAFEDDVFDTSDDEERIDQAI